VFCNNAGDGMRFICQPGRIVRRRGRTGSRRHRERHPGQRTADPRSRDTGERVGHPGHAGQRSVRHADDQQP
jgi:hypothetical protein